jgi:23S rRNA pseudouridine1911/1915/1917 synthase
MPISRTVAEQTELLPFLFAWQSGVKRTKVRQWLKHGSVLVNGEPVTHSSHWLETGDVVSISGEGERRTSGLLPRRLKVVFEDESLIVIEKPENLLSMASANERERTAYALLTNYVRGGRPRRPERVWIVHRLDREASGLMVFAKTKEAKLILQANWGDAEKRYLAVVEGHPPADEGVLRSHLDENSPFKVYRAPSSKRTRLAVTHYRVLKRRGEYALVELTLETGRRHQIRVQLADVGCPIVGDRKYGARTNPARRLGLHATLLQFQHPLSGELLRFESQLPRNLARLV